MFSTFFKQLINKIWGKPGNYPHILWENDNLPVVGKYHSGNRYFGDRPDALIGGTVIITEVSL